MSHNVNRNLSDSEQSFLLPIFEAIHQRYLQEESATQTEEQKQEGPPCLCEPKELLVLFVDPCDDRSFWTRLNPEQLRQAAEDFASDRIHW